FEELKDTKTTSASSHFIIGLDGEIVQCIPLSEVAYASKERNADTISIECCHPEADGKFSDATYASLVELSAFLCKSFDIDPQEIIRHYDVTGKLCPLYYVEHPDEWQELKDRIEARTDEMIAAAAERDG
ncbi:MAG: peptidoglycan recognition family protein, partial [Lachnospiraceae bacterium]|nr:peptidoglycan recognition family protein [Lachnospiraceae bacterium]